MVRTGAIGHARWLILAHVAVLAGCAELPRIAGSPLPPVMDEPAPVYRDLADIPGAPLITSHSDNESVIQALSEDRAKTAQAAEGLRREPFDQPDSSKPPGF